MTVEGRAIGRYRDLVLIGQGGFGTVYRALDADHGRQVAIKILPGAMGEAERRRFDRERQAMGRLGTHPNIVGVHDSGYSDSGEAYIVMELAAGGSLSQRLESAGTLPWPEAVETMADIAAAANVAHSNGVLHRDIKPDNVLIDEYGTAKLTDFGIAAVASNATATTSTTATLAHAAPEVLEGRPSTEAVDVYAIGSTLHTLLSGAPPFYRPADEMIAAMVTRVATEPPPDLRTFGVPEAVAAAVERSLAKLPEQRQQSAGQLEQELRAALAAPGAAAPPTVHRAPSMQPTVVATPTPPLTSMPSPEPVVPSVPDEPRRSTPILWAALGLLALVLVAAAAFLLGSGRSGDDDEITSATDPTSTSASTSSTTNEATTTSTTTASTTTTTVLVERQLTDVATVSASGSASPGNDACGELTTFGPDNLVDGDGTTAWRVGGDGIGERLQIQLDDAYVITSVGLVPGYAKVDLCDGTDRYTQNRRIVAVRWSIGELTIDQVLDPDQPQLQTLRLDEPTTTSSIAVEILATTEDGGRDFAAISEIDITGG